MRNPTYRNVNDLEPQACDICSTLVGSVHLVWVDEGKLAGFSICDTKASCRTFRRLSRHDKVRLYGRDYPTEGNAQAYPSGGRVSWDSSLDSF